MAISDPKSADRWLILVPPLAECIAIAHEAECREQGRHREQRMLEAERSRATVRERYTGDEMSETS